MAAYHIFTQVAANLGELQGVYFMGKEATKEAIRFANREDVQQSVRIVKKLVNNDPQTWWWFIRRLSRY